MPSGDLWVRRLLITFYFNRNWWGSRTLGLVAQVYWSNLAAAAGSTVQDGTASPSTPSWAQRLAGPMFTDFAEETVLNGVPFGGAAGVVAHGHPQTKPVHQLFLQDIFPGAHPGAVTAAAVG